MALAAHIAPLARYAGSAVAFKPREGEGEEGAAPQPAVIPAKAGTH